MKRHSGERRRHDASMVGLFGSWSCGSGRPCADGSGRRARVRVHRARGPGSGAPGALTAPGASPGAARAAALPRCGVDLRTLVLGRRRVALQARSVDRADAGLSVRQRLLATGWRRLALDLRWLGETRLDGRGDPHRREQRGGRDDPSASPAPGGGAPAPSRAEPHVGTRLLVLVRDPVRLGGGNLGRASPAGPGLRRAEMEPAWPLVDLHRWRLGSPGLGPDRRSGVPPREGRRQVGASQLLLPHLAALPDDAPSRTLGPALGLGPPSLPPLPRCEPVP